MVYVVLLLLFGSFLQRLTILFSLPLSILRDPRAVAFNMSISMAVVIGILMLMGDFIASVGVFEVDSDDRARQRRQAIYASINKRQSMALNAKAPLRAYSSRCTGNKRHTIGYALAVRQDQANLQADMPLGPWMPARRLAGGIPIEYRP